MGIKESERQRIYPQVPDEVLVAVHNLGPMWVHNAVVDARERERQAREAAVRPDDGAEPPSGRGIDEMNRVTQAVLNEKHEPLMTLDEERRAADRDLVRAQVRGQGLKNQILHERLLKERVATAQMVQTAKHVVPREELIRIGVPVAAIAD